MRLLLAYGRFRSGTAQLHTTIPVTALHRARLPPQLRSRSFPSTGICNSQFLGPKRPLGPAHSTYEELVDLEKIFGHSEVLGVGIPATLLGHNSNRGLP